MHVVQQQQQHGDSISSLGGGGHDLHPSVPSLVLLVFAAILEVICTSLPGYIIARLGFLNVEHQKFLANLNVWLFTPCLSEYDSC